MIITNATNITNYPRFPNIVVIKKTDGSYDDDTICFAFEYIRGHVESIVFEELKHEIARSAKPLYPPGVSASSTILRLCFGRLLEKHGIVEVVPEK